MIIDNNNLRPQMNSMKSNLVYLDEKEDASKNRKEREIPTVETIRLRNFGPSPIQCLHFPSCSSP